MWCPGEVEAASCQRRHVGGLMSQGPAGIPAAMKNSNTDDRNDGTEHVPWNRQSSLDLADYFSQHTTRLNGFNGSSDPTACALVWHPHAHTGSCVCLAQQKAQFHRYRKPINTDFSRRLYPKSRRRSAAPSLPPSLSLGPCFCPWHARAANAVFNQILVRRGGVGVRW